MRYLGEKDREMYEERMRRNKVARIK
jgi:hypothetical protein